MDKKTCFVIMGYGIKKVYGLNIDIDLNKVYFDFIKPVLIKNNLISLDNAENYRGDEVPTTESISKNFLKSLYLSDFVIADISTLNENAIYELGLRHAMKPKSTIILCDSFTFNSCTFFDISMQPQLIYNYEKFILNNLYLKEIQDKLSNLIQTCYCSDEMYIDSPVFDLNLYEIIPEPKFLVYKNSFDKSLREIISEGTIYLDNKDFINAEICFKKALEFTKDLNVLSKYILSKYKKSITVPNLISTLKELECKIDLNLTTHEDCLGIAGAINKQLFLLTKEIKYYDRSVAYYRNGSNYESGNLYCARNYCAMLLKKYLTNSSIEEIKEFFYVAKHNARIFINRSKICGKNYTDVDDMWYNSNITDLYYIIYGKYDEFLDINPINLRQTDTINYGREEIIKDYSETIKLLNYTEI